ncbi:amidohydrolase family protein [Roseomonas alkaliterrae]|uniref:N-acyl-D-aspartate/D-glutamate deacylase n=1 Tax=Neoroseomonas alkaliterrae TaxID=1452450 RepID=A0A840YAB5_9PROT|nr:amidohydrolase family protein [Neoroseomonas alkaliterrae]MBB5690943.1 N-acyl-D-aspartate/D-glutamate deacylase [Neoroseomonas alkaliterrae]MBR0674682.1 amidohydrolase family protein [Neoroseomonas alkaliterrae]
MADLVIRGGTVVDGTGAAPVEADVAIEGGRITEIGRVAARGREEIDARGRIVSPGFVDIHTHYDGQAVWDSHLAPSAWHGVTTAVMGNCGVGFAPCRAADREKLIELMEGVEDIPGPILHEGLDWRWETFPEYLDALDAKPRDIDICTLLPHGALRVHVMGSRGLALENANQADIARMREITAEAVRAGAFGVSTSRTISHRTLKGDPTPTLRAQEEELRGLAEGLRDAGGGLLELVSDWNTPDPATEFGMVRRVVEATGQRVLFSLTARHDRTEAWKELLAMSDAAAAEGLPIRPVFPPRPIGILLGLNGSQNPFSGCPSYKAIAHLPAAQRAAAMREPALRARILSEDRVSGSTFPLITRLSFERMFPFGDPPDYAPPREASIAAIAAREGRRAEEVAYDILTAHDGQDFIFAPLTNFHDYTLSASAECLRHPNAIAGLSDGGAHVGFISDGSFPTFLLAYWARDAKEQVFALPEIVRRLTSDTARAAGLADRGVLRPGMKADVNVFDMAALGLDAPRMVNDLPAGGRRLLQRARGYVATVVAGQVTYRDGEATGALPGRLVRKAA